MKRTWFAVIWAVILPSAISQAGAWIPFVIPWDDATPNVATDVSRLNHPALPRIVRKGAGFAEEPGQVPVRFWATNLTAREAFPTHQEADKLAAHLAKYGVNLVRLHHLDNSWSGAEGTWWDTTQKKKVLSPTQMDKLHYLIAALAKHGIYSNLNLKVSKELHQVDGAATDARDPRLPKGMGTEYQKKIDRFDRFLIDHQKEIARQVLTAKNPYRQNMTLAEDPAIAFVEINNENAAAGWPGQTPGLGLTELPEPYLGQLQAHWNRWLVAQYGSEENLRKAWYLSLERPGEEILKNSPSAQWRANRIGSVQNRAEAHPPGDEQATRFHITDVDQTDWHAQGLLPLPALVAGKQYTLEFQAAASPARSMRVSVDRNQSPWDNQGLTATIQLTPEFSAHRLTFTAGMGQPQRLTLQLGTINGDVSIRRVALRPGVVVDEPDGTRSIDHGTLPLPQSTTLPTIQRDWRRFVTDLDTAFADEMRQFIRQELHSRALLADTQMGWGGIGSIQREQGSDFADAHAYWNHPVFPGRAWSRTDWRVDQKSLVLDALCQGTYGTFSRLAWLRVADKPFTLSEYDHPAPNDYVSEMLPLISSFAAMQDWSAVYTFCYGGYGAHASTDRIQSFFDNSSHPAKWAFTPSAALIFRSGLVAPLPSVAQLQVPADIHADHWTPASAWESAGGMPNPLTHRMEIRPQSPTLKQISIQTEGSPSPVVKRSKSRLELSVPKAYIASGHLVDQPIAVSRFTMKIDPFDGSFASMTLVPLDNQPLDESRHLLLTIVGRAENLQMGWNAQRTSVSDQWGHGPVQVQRITAQLTGPDGMKVYPLTPTGSRMLPVTQITGDSVWYEWVIP